MFVFVAANLLVIPLFFMAHPRPGPVFHGLFVPGIKGGTSSTAVLLVIAIIGTTVAPWQLFFQQSNIVDKRITPRWINYERIDTIIGSFRSAAITALIAIAAILFITLRRLLDVTLVLAPLLLSALLTVLVAVLAPVPLNFANIIALPLLLGVGVSFNIYFVMNWRAGQTSILGSATARAILFSALTTGTAFGSLALSGHPGTASMGRLLLISLACTLMASLVFIPALLSSVHARTRR